MPKNVPDHWPWPTISSFLGPFLHTWDWEPVSIPLQALSLVEKMELVQVPVTLNLTYQRECEMDVESTWIPTWHRMGRVSMGTWTIFKNRLLKVHLIQNQEIMTLRMITTVDLFHFIMHEDLHEYRFLELRFGRGPDHIYIFTLHLRVRNHATWFWRWLGTAFGHLFFWALTISWSHLLARVWSRPYNDPFIHDGQVYATKPNPMQANVPFMPENTITMCIANFIPNYRCITLSI